MSDKPVCAVIGFGPQNGEAFARRFAADGHAVALLSRRTEGAERVAAELDDAVAVACDATSEISLETAFAAIRKRLGEVETLIYNAGSGSWGNIEEITAAQLEDAWRVNTLGLFLTARQVIPAMKERGRGNIIVVGATASLRGKPFTTAFAPAKAAQRSLAQAMARHLGPTGVHVSLLIIDGRIGERGTADPDRLDPDDIAGAAAFLAAQPRSAWTFELDLRPSTEAW
jgi:NAD(P)-dependent dehydrogenase (short-subunit alcohol dehydrogenase family)